MVQRRVELLILSAPHFECGMYPSSITRPKLWQGKESNLRHRTYEARELPLLYPAIIYRTDRTRTCDTKLRRLVFLFQLNYSPKCIIVLVMQTIMSFNGLYRCCPGHLRSDSAAC